jgi:hypothetical protein
MSDKSNIPLTPAHIPNGTIQNTASDNIGDLGAITSRKREWYSRGYLPHRDRIHLLQSITFRLADSMPQELLEQLEKELQEIPSIVKTWKNANAWNSGSMLAWAAAL